MQENSLGSGMTAVPGGIVDIVAPDEIARLGRTARVGGDGAGTCRSVSDQARSTILTTTRCKKKGGSNTFAIRARRKLRTRNLNLSSSVWRTTSVKLDFGSMVPVISSIVSIYTEKGARSAFPPRLKTRHIDVHSTYLLLHPFHHALNQLHWVRQQPG